MKINKFNEELNNHFTLEDLKKNENMKVEIKEFEEKICKLLTQYLLLNPEISIHQELDEDTYVSSFTYYENKYGKGIDFSYEEPGDEDNWEASLDKKQFDNFLEFMKNPEVYKQGKKYNL